MGRSIALTLAREGADLILTYRRGGEEAEQVAAAVRSQGQRALSLLGGRAFSSAGVHRAPSVRALTLRADATVEADVAALWREGEAAFGAIDIVVVGAGGPWTPQPFTAISLDHWREVQAAEQDAAFLCLRAALPGMRQRHWGRIVLIGGHAAEQWTMTPPEAPMDYPLGKAARHWLARHLGETELEHGITVNAIAPAWIPHIDFEEAVAQARGADPEWRERRRPAPQDIAEMTAFLCSEAARFVSGNVISVMPAHFPDETAGAPDRPPADAG